MNPTSQIARPLGTMVAYGFSRGHLDTDLAIARQLGASKLEILPDCRAFPSTSDLRSRIDDKELVVYSAHGCWGGQSIRAKRVDLSETERFAHREAIDDLKRCLDWLAEVDGKCLVVHPGGLSEAGQQAARRTALRRGLVEVADHAQGLGLVVCVENMPPGVFPGSRMADLAELGGDLDRPELALALDTGHANLTSSAAGETLAAGGRLRTTHVHDNNGRQDAHLPPGFGTVDWPSWVRALDAIGYTEPVMLECIRYLRENPDSLGDGLLALLDSLTSGRGGGT